MPFGQWAQALRTNPAMDNTAELHFGATRNNNIKNNVIKPFYLLQLATWAAFQSHQCHCVWRKRSYYGSLGYLSGWQNGRLHHCNRDKKTTIQLARLRERLHSSNCRSIIWHTLRIKKSNLLLRPSSRKVSVNCIRNMTLIVSFHNFILDDYHQNFVTLHIYVNMISPFYSKYSKKSV